MGQASRDDRARHYHLILENHLSRFGRTNGILVFVGLSGVGIWLLPFGVTLQMTVLMHTVLGCAVLIPLTVWQARHWLAARKAPRSFRKLCAYAGLWVLAIAAASGLILTWEAIFSLYTGRLLGRIHLWTGLAALPLIGYHMFPRARNFVRGMDSGQADAAGFQLSRARRKMWLVTFGTALGALLVVGAASVVYRAYAPDFGRYKLTPNYKMPYGKDPFAPSMARTVSGGPVAPELLAGSRSCGAPGCHTEIYQEWAASSHRWSSEDKFFQAVQGAMITQEGAPATRYCAGCHDPVSLLSAYKNASNSIEAPGFKEGSSCVVCHAMRRVDVQGNGNYVWGPPKPYLFEYAGAGRSAMLIAHFLIRAWPRQHDLDYDLMLNKRPESCGACHKQFIDKEINHVGWVQLQNQYDDWKHGKWNTAANLDDRLKCQQCHMYYREASRVGLADPYDRKTGLGLKHRNHWFAAANQVMPEMLGAPDAVGQTQRVIAWLKGEQYVPEIAKVWPKGVVIPVKIVPPDSLKPGTRAEFRTVISNNKAGHSFPTGPLDLIRAWVEAKVVDASGRVLFQSGELKPDGHLEAGTFVLKAEGINAEGREIVRHDLWHYVGAKWKRAIFPGYSDMYEYYFQVPHNAKGPLTITARLRYRKANQYFMEFAFPGKHIETPITDLSADRVEVPFSVREEGQAEALKKVEAGLGASVSER